MYLCILICRTTSGSTRNTGKIIFIERYYTVRFGCHEKLSNRQGTPAIRVFDETLFRIFAKHETRKNAPVFRETFASFANILQDQIFAIFVFRENKLIYTTEHARGFTKSGGI